jgi:tRNA G18 (ribose-2'-O)-methylase SpoU
MKNIQLKHEDHINTNIKIPLCYLAHDIDVPMNVGSLFRIADALGISKIYLTGNSIVPPNSKIRKTSRSTEKYVDYEYREDPTEIISALKEQGYRIISLEITSSSIDLRDLEVKESEKICLIVGSENKGVIQPLLDMSDQTIHIPMLGRNSSMNLANATAIASFEIFKGINRCKRDQS